MSDTTENPWARVCPDCGAPSAAALLRHQSGCPIGDGYDAIQVDDRAFFDRYPAVDVRRRKPVLAELLDVLLAAGTELPPNPFGKAWTPAGHVLVFRTDNPDVRWKSYEQAYLVADPDRGAPTLWVTA
jgi:hypothetical protein